MEARETKQEKYESIGNWGCLESHMHRRQRKKEEALDIDPKQILTHLGSEAILEAKTKEGWDSMRMCLEKEDRR